MLFDLSPKLSRESLFGRDSELSSLVKHLKNGRWVVLLGARMVGKTSLARAAESELKLAGIDALYVNLWGINTLSALLEKILYQLNADTAISARLSALLSAINGINIGPAGVTFDRSVKPVPVFQQVFTVLGKQKKPLVIFLDEVQELSSVTPHLTRLLANIFATYPKIVFAFTGSYSGLVKALLKPGPTSPLYGRSPAPIHIYSFNQKIAKSFLQAGFQEHGITLGNTELEEILNRFNGTPGWLTLYGNSFVISGYPHEKALEKTEKEAFKIVQSTLDHYLAGKNRNLHLTVFRALTVPASWSEIHHTVIAVTGQQLNDASLKNVLDSMKAAFLIEERNFRYHISDPVMRRFILHGRPKRGG
jgi:AAA+ ATPase superfamily predicted ATPase